MTFWQSTCKIWIQPRRHFPRVKFLRSISVADKIPTKMYFLEYYTICTILYYCIDKQLWLNQFQSHSRIPESRFASVMVAFASAMAAFAFTSTLFARSRSRMSFACISPTTRRCLSFCASSAFRHEDSTWASSASSFLISTALPVLMSARCCRAYARSWSVRADNQNRKNECNEGKKSSQR